MADSVPDTDTDILDHSVWATIHHCTHCGKEPAIGQKLKQCAGCLAAPTYCGIECQRADWPVHRLAFHDPSLKYGFSYEIPQANDPERRRVSRLAADFLEVHKWAISTAALATRVLHHGISLDACPKDRVLLCDFDDRWPVGLSRRYVWDNIQLVPVDKWLEVICSLGSARMTKIKRAFENARERADALYGHTPGYLGTLPIVFNLNTFVILWHINPQFKPTHPNPLPPRELLACRPALEDMRRLLSGGVALPGRFVRSEGRPVWKQYIDSWVDYKKALRRYPEVAQAFKGPFVSRMEPGLIMGLTDQFR
ncbi:hypothetical protein OH76DRAFT_1484191 [Lentinus brumalis]|uniref:MYND-type domain-containing protein n=1 Tax=Lentinus brumalis TaxID=2498619 RepID=A0A371D672_9APHY|nr:hypothetical protein OH76DRAFT_1484191 [Polyporus brumalis]